jgi:protein-tyrosine phosphatase
MRFVLFLCTGNYYRSRFAEEIFNHLAPSRCPRWRAASRGVAVEMGSGNVGPIARATVSALQSRGVNVDRSAARTPQQASLADLESADHIVALKRDEHLPLLQKRFPAWFQSNGLRRVEFWRVDDVDCATPDQALPLIETEVGRLIARFAAEH